MAWTKDEWEDMAVTIASQVEVELCCDREAVVDEAFVVRAATTFLQARWSGNLALEKGHPDIDRAFIDLVGYKSGDGDIRLALEAKYVKSKGGTREWLKEVVVDLFRLQHLTTQVSIHADRILVVAGKVEDIEKHIVQKAVHATTPRSAKTRPYPALLDTALSTGNTFPIKRCNVELKKWLKKVALELKKNLPVSCKVKLVS